MMKRILLSLVLAASVGGALAACNNSATPSPSPSVAAPSVEASAPAASESAPAASEAAPSASAS